MRLVAEPFSQVSAECFMIADRKQVALGAVRKFTEQGNPGRELKARLLCDGLLDRREYRMLKPDFGLPREVVRHGDEDGRGQQNTSDHKSQRGRANTK